MFVLGSLAALIRQRSLEETLKVSEEAGGVLPSAGSLMSGFRETLASLSGPLKIFLFVDFIFTFALGLGDPYYVTFAIEGVGLSASQWGITTTLTLLVNCAVLLLVAAPSDDLGRMRFVLASMISWPITYLLYVNSTSFTWVLVTRIAVTLSAAVGQPAWTALFVDFCPREHRGRFNALAMVAWSLLYGGGNYLGGVLIEGHGVSAPFLVAAALMSIGALIAVFTLKEPQKREE
jgi:MFS family permease